MADDNIADKVDVKFTYVYLPVIIISILGVVSNVLLLGAFIKDPLKCFRNSGTYLLINLSVSDCLTCVCYMLASVYAIFRFLSNWFLNLSFVSIASISVDRFLIVAYPIKHRISSKRKAMVLWLAAIWLVSCVIPVCKMFFESSTEIDGSAYVIFCGILIILSTVMYSSTYYKLKKQSSNMALHSSTECRAQEIRILKEKRFLKTIIVIACVAFVCTVPFMVFLIIDYFTLLPVDDAASQMALMLLLSIFLTNFAVNPLIYILRLPNYRKTFHAIYCRRASN